MGEVRDAAESSSISRRGWQVSGLRELPDVQVLRTAAAHRTAVRQGSASPHRAAEISDTNILTGEHFPTSDGDVIVHPVNHAGVVFRWKDVVIYSDPVGAARFNGLNRPTLILITDVRNRNWY